MTPAVFLDRDGTMIEDVGYLDSLSRVAFYPWTVDTIRMLNRVGLPVVVVTNQSGVARGLFSEAFVAATHRLMDTRLAAGGARVDGYYYCPHHPSGSVQVYARPCGCRKPGRGMIDRAVGDLGLDAARSFVVGDSWSDVGLGRAVGARTILVRTGSGAADAALPAEGLTADAVVDNLAAAASWIIRHLNLNSNPNSDLTSNLNLKSEI